MENQSWVENIVQAKKWPFFACRNHISVAHLWNLEDFRISNKKKIIGKFNREKKLLAKNTVFCVKYYNCNTFTLLHTGTRAGRASVEKQHITPLSPRFERSAHRVLLHSGRSASSIRCIISKVHCWRWIGASSCSARHRTVNIAATW